MPRVVWVFVGHDSSQFLRFWTFENLLSVSDSKSSVVYAHAHFSSVAKRVAVHLNGVGVFDEAVSGGSLNEV